MYRPVSWALALFVKASLFFGAGAFRPFISGGLGGGQIRHVVTFGAYQDCGADAHPDLRRQRGGGAGAGPGGRRVVLQVDGDSFGIVASSNVQMAEPKFTANVDLNAGVAFNFCRMR